MAENGDSIHAPFMLNGVSPSVAKEKIDKDYKESLENADIFWGQKANKYISWFTPYDQVCDGTFLEGDINWFTGGLMNVCYNCVDKHLPAKADEVAMIWEGDDPTLSRKITFSQLRKDVCRIANVMKSYGVKKGDCVTIYMPMVPELAMTMLACARIGAVHSVVFAGFSAESLKGRILDCNSKYIFTSDEGLRGGKTIKLKGIVDEAVNGVSSIENVFLFKRTGNAVNVVPGRDIHMEDALLKARPYCPCEPMNSEDYLFILYTSGSTGKPKGVAHSSAGYLLWAGLTTEYSFNLKAGDVFACVADCGWITGHTYVVYGPLSLGVTTVLFESVPTYPNPYRYWDMVQKHKITQFYTAPTAIRTLMRFDSEPIKAYDLSSLSVLGSVGEPINPAAWAWYNEHVGRGKCSIADTYWQTETGGHIATSLPGATGMKAGSCGFPYFGINFAVIDPKTGKELSGEAEGVLCIKKPWPGIARTVYGDHDRYLNVYMRPYPGYFFTGDGCRRDADGFYWITGRVDDVVNPSGHRLGTAEIESALVACDECSEAAVVGFPHEVKGEGICCYVILVSGMTPSNELTTRLKNAVRGSIGPFATPDVIIYGDLPKTRSGEAVAHF
jgi:acetyl-CoA synthetase